MDTWPANSLTNSNSSLVERVLVPESLERQDAGRAFSAEERHDDQAAIKGAHVAEVVDPLVGRLVLDGDGLVVLDDPGRDPVSPGSHGARYSSAWMPRAVTAPRRPVGRSTTSIAMLSHGMSAPSRSVIWSRTWR